MCPGVLQPAHYLKSCPNIRILNLASRWSWSTNKCSQYMLKLSPVVLNASVLLVPFRNTGVSFQCFLAGHAFKGPGCTFYFSMARKPPSGPGTPHCRGFTITLKKHHTRQDSFGRVKGMMQRPVPDYTQHSPRNRYPCPRRDSNPQASGRRLTP